jgi:phosphoglycolate phosphatase
VLVDSRPGIGSCIAQTLAERAYPGVSDARIERMIGPPLAIGFAELLEEFGGDSSDTAACVRRFRELYAERAVGGTRLQAGIAQALDALASRAVLAVATSKPMRFTEPILAALGIAGYFAAVSGPTPQTDGESKAATLRRAMRTLAAGAATTFDRSNAAMIGDRHFDIAAALELGIMPIGVTWGFGSADELRDAGAAHVIDSPSELVSTIFGANTHW